MDDLNYVTERDLQRFKMYRKVQVNDVTLKVGWTLATCSSGSASRLKAVSTV
jgi:hypothetical protein